MLPRWQLGTDGAEGRDHRLEARTLHAVAANDLKRREAIRQKDAHQAVAARDVGDDVEHAGLAPIHRGDERLDDRVRFDALAELLDAHRLRRRGNARSYHARHLLVRRHHLLAHVGPEPLLQFRLQVGHEHILLQAALAPREFVELVRGPRCVRAGGGRFGLG
eukprot:6321531-Prymnesium_polylepis.1